MARLNIDVAEPETLESLIPQYADNKAIQDKYKKICDEQNTKIKTLMEEANTDTFTAGGYTAKYSVQHRETMNEEKLIQLLESSCYKPEGSNFANVCIASGLNIVKMKPYVDMDALEDAIYKGLIPEEVLIKMADCKEVKDVVTLRVSKEKKKKDEE